MFASLTLFIALAFACFAFVPVAFGQEADDLYQAIIATIGSGDEALARELAQAAASAGITVSDIINPLPPIPQQDSGFTASTLQSETGQESGVAVGFNFLAVSIGVAVIIFLMLLFALSRRFKHEKERIDESKEAYESHSAEPEPFVPSSRNLD